MLLLAEEQLYLSFNHWLNYFTFEIMLYTIYCITIRCPYQSAISNLIQVDELIKLNLIFKKPNKKVNKDYI